MNIIGYMCRIDFQYEVGAAADGNAVFLTAEDCTIRRRCSNTCGIVQVEVVSSDSDSDDDVFVDLDEVEAGDAFIVYPCIESKYHDPLKRPHRVSVKFLKDELVGKDADKY